MDPNDPSGRPSARFPTQPAQRSDTELSVWLNSLASSDLTSHQYKHGGSGCQRW